MFVLAAITILVLAADEPSSAWPGDDTSLDSYRARVALSLERIALADSAAQVSDLSLPGLPTLLREGNEVLRLDSSWLNMELDSLARAGPKDFGDQQARVVGMLERIRESLEFGEGAVIDRAYERERLREILARPEFGSQEKETAPSWLEEILLKIVNGIPAWSFDIVPYILGGIALLVLAYIIVLVVRNAGPRTKKIERPEFEAGTIEPAEPALDSRKLRARSEQMIAEGRLRESVRLGFHAFLAALDESGVLKRRPDRTNRELLRLLPRSDRAELSAAAASLVRGFEWAWYGGVEPSKEEAGAYVDEVESIGDVIERSQESREDFQ